MTKVWVKGLRFPVGFPVEGYGVYLGELKDGARARHGQGVHQRRPAGDRVECLVFGVW